ncbi:hypothetical protein CB0940_10339 [Cercospora beticola]|uniref:Uncharacterized protein n=1 Tax=Cercospora beticola TaxID=122368 RepID=A0A2G5HU05_CERBT|nr:hypothetical protein CB0940_10339 [Cercospora beticola]PIA95763.1 hypothetical protein CB0940_10339 [Cercospora beticola]WPB07053.1 hypothetical protein RHO25_011713 [Cercospora beticola]CAK1366998.1 unnamed protein product [Cercospora beticola]
MDVYEWSESGPILETLHRHPDGKIGFVIYRTHYDDDQKWAQFVKRLTDSASYTLSHDDICFSGDMRGEELKKVFAYDIRDDKATLEDASVADIRRIFCEWKNSVPDCPIMPKYDMCVLADKEVIDSVMEDARPWKNDRPRGHVKLVRADHKKEWHEAKEGYPAIDGSTAHDVGWMKQAVAYLFPRLYSVLLRSSWGSEYRRPPRIRED